MRYYAKSPLLNAALVVLFLAILEISVIRVFQPLENHISDLLVKTHARSLMPDPDIIIIDIDEKSLEKMSKLEGRWPWPRSIHAELIEGIQQQKPKAILFDILFSDPDTLRKESDAYLAETANKYTNVYFPIMLVSTNISANWPDFGELLGFNKLAIDTSMHNNRGLILPYTPIEKTGRLGTINFSTDLDEVGRIYRLYDDVHGWRIPSLSARVASDLGYPLPDTQDITLHWRGDLLSYKRISYFDLYENFNKRVQARDPMELHNKIIIIGTSAPGLHDLRSTPITNQHPAFEILATAIDNIKNQRYMERVPQSFEILLAFILIASLYAAFQRYHHPLKAGVDFLVVSVILLITSYIAVTQLYLINVVTPLISGWIFLTCGSVIEYLREGRARKKSVEMFSRFLDPRVVKEIISGDASSALKTEAKEITILFSDIRGFTSLSENRDAEEIVALLNEYFSRQVKIIFRHGGTMDKFIGDAIMAFWGAPVKDINQSENAIAAALEMSDVIETFKSDMGEIAKNFDIGIGIHTGSAVVGIIGFEQRMDYTCIGDTVNVASRIEGKTKGLCRVLVSEETMLACKNKFDFIDHGFIHVKGREQSVHLYEPTRRNS